MQHSLDIPAFERPEVSMAPGFTGLLVGGSQAMQEDGAPLFSHALDMSGVENPKVLWVPSSAGYKRFYDKTAANMARFFTNLGATSFDALHDYPLVNEHKSVGNEINPEILPTTGEAQDLIGNANLLFVTGGNPLQMRKLWDMELPETAGERMTIWDILKQRILNGDDVAWVGQSAGYNGLSELAHSDWKSYGVDSDPDTNNSTQEWSYHTLRNPDPLMNGTYAIPHYGKNLSMWDGAEPIEREDDADVKFRALVKEHPEVAYLGIGIDDGAGMEIVNGHVRALQGLEIAGVKGRNANRRAVILLRNTPHGIKKFIMPVEAEPVAFEDLPDLVDLDAA